MSADLIRWMFSRSNPANNIDFGPGPAEELRSKFTLKLWNTYAFFCNNARQAKGGYNLAAPETPVRERPDLDRWILSDLQKLIESARQAFEKYDLVSFCLEAEKFVDDKLSNWYVRRTRPRFWDGDQAAYQTLYTVLTTLAKLFAPITPFLAETKYQNLKTEGGPGSVHLCAYPQADRSLIDEGLSGDMDALLRLVSLGLAARNTVKIRVRQPLAEMKVQPAGDRERRAVERFPDQILEELNVKKVTLHDPAGGPLLSQEVKPNMKALGPKFGPRLKEVQAALGEAPADLAAKAQAGAPFELQTRSGPVTLEPSDVVVQQKAPDGWAGVADRGTQVLIDTRVTPELAREGMARDVIRYVQNTRKEANLEMEDRIALWLDTSSAPLREAIDAHRDYICGETLTVQWATAPLNGQAHRANVKVEGQPLTIELSRAPADRDVGERGV
jgi:isoleucyl-tRNA synthetase